MRMYNTNKMTITIKLAHWNRGSSHLGTSNLGKAKLENIKFLLSKHKLDVLGVSEANIERGTQDHEYRVHGYSTKRRGVDIHGWIAILD